MGPSVLVVDDDPDVRQLLREFLTGEGFIVHVANDGAHALRLLERNIRPDVILLDYKMPLMDGKQFLGATRENPAWKAIPVVILSAWTREWSGARLEVADVLNKPLDLELLLQTVRRLAATTAGQAANPGRRD